MQPSTRQHNMLRIAFRDALEVFKSEFDNVPEKLEEVDGM